MKRVEPGHPKIGRVSSRRLWRWNGIARMLAATGTFCALLAPAGCVERTLKITSEPPGAVAYVNDEPVGVTPAKVAFTWYGDYDIILRKEGYETLKTHHRVNPPWYQLPPIDLFAEAFWPGMITDARELPTYELEPATPPAAEELVERAEQLRDRTLYSD